MILTLSKTEFLPSHQNHDTFSSLAQGAINSITVTISQIAFSILLPLNLLFSNIAATSSVLKKISRNILHELNPDQFKELRTALASSVSLINFIQIALDVDYVVNSRFKTDSKTTITGRFFLFIARFLDCLIWLAKDDFINLEKISSCLERIANSLGRFRFFISNLLLNSVMNGSMAIYHLLSMAEACIKLHQTENLYQQQLLFIETGKQLAECSLALLMISSFNFSAIISMVCISLEFIDLIYRECYEA